MVGMKDRGEIAPGKRADLVRVQTYQQIPAIKSVWQGGRQVA